MYMMYNHVTTYPFENVLPRTLIFLEYFTYTHNLYNTSSFNIDIISEFMIY